MWRVCYSVISCSALYAFITPRRPTGITACSFACCTWACSPGKTTMQWQPLIGTIGAPARPDPIPEFRPGPKVSYLRQWLLVGLLFGTGGWFYTQQKPQ